jgi:hypothetical protein
MSYRQLISQFIMVVMTDFGIDRKCINITTSKVNMLLSMCTLQNAKKAQKK